MSSAINISNTPPAFVGRVSRFFEVSGGISLLVGGALISLGTCFLLAQRFSHLKSLKWAQVANEPQAVILIVTGSGVCGGGCAFFSIYLIQKNTVEKRQKRAFAYSLGLTKNEGYLIDCLWKRYAKQWDATCNSPEEIQSMWEHLKDSLIYIGKGQSETTKTNQDVSKIVHFLFQNEASPPISKKLAKVVLWKDSPDLKKEMLFELEKILKTNPSPDISQEFSEGYLGSALSLVPFCDPSLGENLKISIPKQKGGFTQVNYKIDQIFELSPNWIGSTMPAYGLIADDENYSPLLLFKGTTYPTDRGAFASYFSDFTPGCSVGEAAFHFGFQSLEHWLKDKTNVRAIGMSLGGALSILAGQRFQQVTNVQAYNPAGVYPWVIKKDSSSLTRVYIQEGDAVSVLGYFPGQAKIYQLISKKACVPQLIHHATMAWEYPSTLAMIQLGTKNENSRIKRHLLTGGHLILGPLLVFPLLSLGWVVTKTLRGSLDILSSPTNSQ